MENLIKASSVLYDKEICDTMNKLKLDEKIIMENKLPEVVFKNTDEYYEAQKKSSKILRDGIENNINKFIKPFDNKWNIREGSGCVHTIYDCFYESIYNCLFNMLDTKIFCKYQAEKISYEIDEVIDVLYNKEILNISHESKEELVELIYDLIYLRLNDDDAGEGFLGVNNMYFVCNNCNKNTKLYYITDNNVNICSICKPSDII